MFVPRSDSAAALASSAGEVENLKNEIRSVQNLRREIETKFNHDTKALMEDIENQTLKFEVHAAKLSLRKFTIADDSDSIIMRLRIISRADKKCLGELEQKASDLVWGFRKRNEKYVGHIENLDREVVLWMAIYTLQETWRPFK